MDYKLPRVQTVFKDLYKYKEPITVAFDVTLLPSTTSIYKNIKKKLEFLVGRVTKYGLIIEVVKIVKIHGGIDKTRSGLVTFRVILLAHVFDPSPNDIIIGCKIILIQPEGLFVKYTDNIKILVNRSELTKEFKAYRVGHIINIQVTGITHKLDSVPYIITYKNEFNAVRKKNVSKLISSYKSYINKSISEFSFFDDSGFRHTMDLNRIMDISFVDQYEIVGKPFLMLDIPHQLRHIEIKTNLSKLPSLSPVFTSNHDDIRINTAIVNKKTDERYVNFDALRSKVFDDEYWEKIVKFAIYPYELLRPRRGYGRRFNVVGFWKSLSILERPVSRAYFKIYELIKAYNLTIEPGDILASIGDAPGGFAQAMSHYFPNTEVITVSLNASMYDYAIPYHKTVINNKKIKIDYLSKNTGDLLDMENIQELIKKYQRTFKIVGADGALSYEGARERGSSKEAEHTGLWLSELIIGLCTLKKHGFQCAKFYGRSREITSEIFYLFASHFKKCEIFKLQSLHNASNEMFIVGYNLIKYPNVRELLSLLSQILSNKTYVKTIFSTPINDPEFYRDVTMFNITIDKFRYLLYHIGYEYMVRMPSRLLVGNDIIQEQKKYIIEKFAPKII